MNTSKDRDWEESNNGSDGVYFHFSCHVCGNSFYGYKRRVFCKSCHELHKVNEGSYGQ